MSVEIFSRGAQEPIVEGPGSKMAVLEETESTVSFREADGTIVVVPKNPQRTIVCINSVMDAWYMAGGKSLARIRGTVNVPDEATDLPRLGTIATLNKELMMELQPDFLVFSSYDSQSDVRQFFSNEGVSGVAITYNNYEDFRVILDLFTRINGTRSIYENTVIPIEKKVQKIINQVPKAGNRPAVCILFATTKYIKVETINTITGYMCEKLGARNIYTDNAVKGATRVDLSLEYIMEQDPDIIFVTTMGDIEKCKSRLDKDVSGNSIWRELSAVKNDRLIYLDKSYSIYKPNRFYPEAFKIMAEFIYPDVRFEF